MLNPPTIDEIDVHILKCLLNDATQSHKSIGELVHLTGQAVGARVRKLQEIGVIEGYTVRWNPEKLGLAVHAFVTVFMKLNSSHQAFQAFAKRNDQVAEMHRVSGEGCYWMQVRVATPVELTEFLDEILHYGNYKVSLSIGKIK